MPTPILGLAEPVADKSLLSLAEPDKAKPNLLNLARPAGVRRVKRDDDGNIVDAEDGVEVPDFESYLAQEKKPTNWGKTIKSAASGLWEGLVKPGAIGVGKLAIGTGPIGQVRSLMEMAEKPLDATTSQKEAAGLVEGGARAVRGWYDIGKTALPAIADKITRGIDMARGFDYDQAAKFEREREYSRFLDRALTQQEREKAPVMLSKLGVPAENVDPDTAVVGEIVLDPTNLISGGVPVSKAIRGIATPLSKIPLVKSAGSKIARAIESPTASVLEAVSAPVKQIGRLAEKVEPAAEKLAKMPLGTAATTALGTYEGYEQGGVPGAITGAVVGSAAIPLLSKIPKVANQLSETLIPLAETAEGAAKAIRGGTGRIAGFGTAANEAVSPTAREALAVAGGALPAEEATRRARALGFAARGIRPAAPIIDSVLHGAGIGAAFGAAESGGDPEGLVAGALQGMGFGLMGSGAGALLNSINKARLGFSPLEVSNYVRQQVGRLPETERQEILIRLQNDPTKFETIVPNLEFIEMARGVGGENVDVQLLSDEAYRSAVAKMYGWEPNDPRLQTQGVTIEQAGGRPQVLVNLDRGDATAHELLHAQEQLLNLVDPTGKIKAAGGLRDAYTAFRSGLTERFSDADLVRHFNEYNRRLNGPQWQDVQTITEPEKALIQRELAADANDRFNMLATALYGIGPDSRRQLARWAASTPIDKIADTISMAYTVRKPGMRMPDESVLFTDAVGDTLRSNARELKNLGNLWVEQGKVLDRLSPGQEELEGGTRIVTKSDQVEELSRSLTNYAEALKNGSYDELLRAEQPLNEVIATGVFATRPKDAGTIYKEAQIRARLKHGRDQVTQAEVDAEIPAVNPVELVNKKNFPLKPGEEPRLASPKERKQAAENQFSALSAALTPVTKQFATREEAMKNAKGELVSYPTADGTMVFEGPHLSEAQLNAVMTIPDIVFPAANKVNLEALNGEAMTGSPRPIEMTYYGAVKNSGNLPRSRRSIHPNGFYLSKAENFVAKSFDRSSMARDVEREGAKPAGTSVYLEPFRKPSEPTYAEALDRFHEAFNRINANHAHGVPGAVGLDPDARRAMELRDAVNGLLGVAPAEINPLASGNNYFKSFRVDRAYNLRAGDELTGKPDYIRAKANFMPQAKGVDLRTTLEKGEPKAYDVKGFHSTSPEYLGSILEKGIVPGFNKPPGQDWMGKYSGKGIYFHQEMPLHEIVDNGYDPDSGLPHVATLEFEKNVPSKKLVPDEETGTPKDTPNSVKEGAPLVIGDTITPDDIKAVHIVDTPAAEAWLEESGVLDELDIMDIPVIFHSPIREGKTRTRERAGEQFMPSAEKREPAPATYIGDMDFSEVGGEKFPLFNLTRDVPAGANNAENVEGSTVSADFLKGAGFDRPEGYSGDFMPSTQPNGDPNPGFYSRLEGGLRGAQKVMTKDQALALVRKSTNAEELKWTGIEGKIEELAAKGKVSVEELRKHLQDEGAVRFEEVTIGENKKQNTKELQIQRLAEEAAQEFFNKPLSQLNARQRAEAMETAEGDYSPGDIEDFPTQVDTKYSQYQLPGGENYREVVLSMPVDVPKLSAKKSNGDRWVVTSEDGRSQGFLAKDKEDALRMGASHFSIVSPKNAYTSNHFVEVPNYVAHMRLNDRVDAEGRPGTFIEELQSDRHQQGREKGYGTSTVVEENGIWRIKNADGTLGGESFDLKKDAEQKAKEGSGSGIPDAPFRKDWPVRMFQRALRDAVASGKDWVGWTDGNTQADRYDLSKQVSSITWSIPKDGDGTQGTLKAQDNSGKEVINQTIPREKIQDYIGKEPAKKLLDQIVDAKSRQGFRTSHLEGEDLKVGGEGMKGFYDQILPSEIGKYVKKWGAKVELSDLPSASKDQLPKYTIRPDSFGEAFVVFRDGDEYDGPFSTKKEAREFIKDQLTKKSPESGVKIHKVPITPQMRESVAKGQPLFMPSAKTVVDKVRAQLQAKAPQALSELDSLLSQLNLPESPTLYQQALDSFDKPQQLRNEGGAKGVRDATNVFTNQNEEDIKPLQQLYADNVWRLDLLSRERYDEQLTTTGLMPTLDFTPATTEYLGIPAPDPELAVKQPSRLLGKLEETRMTNNLVPEGRTLSELGLPDDKLTIDQVPALDAYFGDGNWILKRGDNVGGGEGVWFSDKIKEDPGVLDQVNSLPRRVRTKLFLQRAYDVAGATPSERAQGKTIVPGETRVHVTADQEGNAKVIPYASWVKGEWTPRAIRTPELIQAEESALAAVNALPKDQRPGAMFGVDVVPLREGGYGVVELNPTQLYSAGDKIGAQSSGYLIDSALVQDAYIAGLQGKLPIHARLARLLLAIRGKELAREAGEQPPKAYRREVVPTLGETPSPAIPMGGAETPSGSLAVPL